MAEETQKTAAPEAPATEEVVVVPDVPVAEKPTTTTEKELLAAPEPEPEPEAPVEKITESASFKEETNVVGELPDPQKKALDELKLLIQEALKQHEFTAPPPPPAKEEEKPAEAPAPPAEEEKEAAPAPAPDAAAAEEEEPKSESPSTVAPKTEQPVETKEEEKAGAAVVVAEKVTAIDEDSAKTVEAIKETIIVEEVSSSSESVVAAPPPPAPTEEETPEVPTTTTTTTTTTPEVVSIWGIQLLGGEDGDEEKSDVVLLKFLRARDFKVKEAFNMIKNTVLWRKEFGIEELLVEEEEEDEDDQRQHELDKVVYIKGLDKEGHPVCYNAYGETFQNKELYNNTFGDEEKRQKFLRWRIQFLEKSIRNQLDFSPDGISSFVQVNDLKNSPGLFMTELRTATNQALLLLQDNYPEFLAKQIFINVPWWYLAFYRMISPFFTQRTKSKFVFAGPSKSAETLFKYIAPEQVPVQYGGLSREGDQEFTTADPVTEDTIKPTSKHTIEFPVSEKSLLVWEVRVLVGWDVSYGAEFVPSAEDGYTIIVQKSRKISPAAAADEPIISNSFKVGEPGKVVLTFDNQTSKKKKLLYRSKIKPSDSP